MKVYEKINQLMKTEATCEEIASWAYSNKICPVMLGDALELDVPCPDELDDIASDICLKNKCGFECLTEFLNSEFLENVP
jgi:hypothetical protein